jgi:hypothetical protein
VGSAEIQEVVEQLRLGADASAVAASAAGAAEASLQGASHDPAFLHSFWLLTQIPLAARGPAFADDLWHLGLEVPEQPSLMDVAAAFSGAVDRYTHQRGGRTDLGEMAEMAAVESLTATVGPTLPSLFGATPEEVRRAIGRPSGGDRFSALAREFFTRLTQRSLEYYLSRELSNHIGPGGRFRNDVARAQFDDALGMHCREASRIVEAFDGGYRVPRSAPEQIVSAGPEIRMAIDEDGKHVVFDVWGEIKGVGAELIIALAQPFRPAMRDELAPEHYPFTNAAILRREINCQNQATPRRRVLRCRNQIEKLATNARAARPLPEAVIETFPPCHFQVTSLRNNLQPHKNHPSAH